MEETDHRGCDTCGYWIDDRCENRIIPQPVKKKEVGCQQWKPKLKSPEETKLKPCPFCGGEAIIDDWYVNVLVKCKICENRTDEYKTKDKAIKAWNTRHTPELTDEKIKKQAEWLDVNHHLDAGDWVIAEACVKMAEWMKGQVKTVAPELTDDEPYFGWCDVEGCSNEGVSGGNCWKNTGYWTACSKHASDYRNGKPQPKMEQSAIDREDSRDKITGWLPKLGSK